MDNKIVKWVTLDNITGERVLKQHGIIPRNCKEKYTGEPYAGNISLCKGIAVSEDGERSIPWVQVDDVEPINEKTVCKKCLKIYNSTKGRENG